MSATIGALAPAFLAAQTAMGKATKGKINPHFKNRYADLTEVLDTITPVLHEHGLSLLQLPLESAHGIRLQTVLLHESGEWIADDGLRLSAVKSDPQAEGSALTYARRYGAAAFVGLTQEDDDGAGGSKPAKQKPAKVDLVPKAERDKLEAAIKALPESYPEQIGTQLRQNGIVWTQLTIKQLAQVQDWYDQCAGLAEAEKAS